MPFPPPALRVAALALFLTACAPTAGGAAQDGGDAPEEPTFDLVGVGVDGSGVWQPAWSPDGTKIAFVGNVLLGD